jgi:nitrite reductase/ring-hydroxylating ferredoxin subunit
MRDATGVKSIGTDKRRDRPKPGFAFVCHLSVLQHKAFSSIVLMGKPVAVFKRENGTLFAREMACKHQGADLTKGEIEDWVVTCPHHGRRFDLETGECLNRDCPPLRRHAVVVKGDAVFLSILPL